MSPWEEVINSVPWGDCTAVGSRKEKEMSLLPMGGCNDPNYGLSDQAVPALGRLQGQAQLTEEVGKASSSFTARRWGLGC